MSEPQYQLHIFFYGISCLLGLVPAVWCLANEEFRGFATRRVKLACGYQSDQKRRHSERLERENEDQRKQEERSRGINKETTGVEGQQTENRRIKDEIFTELDGIELGERV